MQDEKSALKKKTFSKKFRDSKIILKRENYHVDNTVLSMVFFFVFSDGCELID